MTEENKSLQTPQNEPEPEAEPVDTAAAMQYFEASEAAAEVGREILASRKPKKQKQKKPKKKKSPVQQEPETAPAPELDAILRAGDRAQQYLAALRSVGTVPAARQRTDSHAFVAALADTANALCRPAKLHFVLQEQWQGQFLCAAPELSRALENMLDNAVRYTPVGGTVTLTISKADGDVAFTVTDTGPGFTPEALHKAGQFLYTDAARPGNGHQGLGLYLARSVAQAYGGKLVLANTDIGAQVQLCLPMQ